MGAKVRINLLFGQGSPFPVKRVDRFNPFAGKDFILFHASDKNFFKGKKGAKKRREEIPPGVFTPRCLKKPLPKHRDTYP